jgi:hypothetical protein
VLLTISHFIMCQKVCKVPGWKRFTPQKSEIIPSIPRR